METITINVSPEIANYFKMADDRDKKQVELYINAWMNDMFRKKSANEHLVEIMKTSSAEAKMNGYKPEMLEDISEDLLKSDDEKAFRQMAKTQFLKGYAESDSIYDCLK